MVSALGLWKRAICVYVDTFGISNMMTQLLHVGVMRYRNVLNNPLSERVHLDSGKNTCEWDNSVFRWKHTNQI